MLASVPDRCYVVNYQDEVKALQVNNQNAVQEMWASNQTTSGGTGTLTSVGPGTYINLMVCDPTVMRDLFVHMGESIGSNTMSKLYLMKYSTRARIVNTQTSTCEFFEYRCRARRDITTQTGSIDGILDGDPDTEQDASGAAKITMTRYGATPFDSSRWCRHFKIIKVKKRILPAAGVVTLMYKEKKRGYMTKFADWYMQTNSAADQALSIKRGQTFSLFRIQGTWSGKTANDAGEKFGPGNASVGILYTIRCHYRYITTQPRVTTWLNALGGISAGSIPAPVAATVVVTGGGGAGPEDQELDE